MFKSNLSTKSMRAAVGAAFLATASFAIGSAQAADLYTPDGPPATFGPSTVLFSGFDVKEDSYFLHLGGVHAWNGDLNTDGWLLRGFVGFGEYDYNAGGALGKVNGDVFTADLMVGYQWFDSNVRYSAYVGGNFADNDLSPNDPANSTRGSEFGAKVQLEAETANVTDYYVSGAASYATTNDDYWARLRVGHTVGAGYVVGPEGVLLGNDEFDQQRIGLFLKGASLGPIGFSVSAGYAFVDGNGDDSVYGSLGASYAF